MPLISKETLFGLADSLSGFDDIISCLRETVPDPEVSGYWPNMLPGILKDSKKKGRHKQRYIRLLKRLFCGDNQNSWNLVMIRGVKIFL